MTPEEGYQEALNRVENVRRSGETILDLSLLRLTNIPFELRFCQDLQDLDLSQNQINQIENLPQGLQRLYLNNNQINQLKNLPQSLQELVLYRNQVSRIENLSQGLWKLAMGGNQISQLENLPQGLRELYLAGNQVSRIENLPQGLQVLYLSDNHIDQIKNLPQGLQELHLNSNQISQIKHLPQGLLTLDLSSNQVSRIENLPQNLQGLELGGNQVSRIENLSQGLLTLNLRYNHISQIEHLPQDLLTLDLNDNQISQIKNLSQSLRKLSLNGNQVSRIENLPQGLQELSLNDNQISQIENLPQSLQELNLDRNQISQIENLPQSLQELDLDRNQIRQIENLPQSLLILNLNDNRIGQIQHLPQGLQKLNLWGNQIRQIEHLPQGLLTLDLSSNQVSRIKNLPQGLQELSLNDNQISQIENLSQSLQKLSLNDNQISQIENLPQSLQELNLDRNQISQIENLPQSLQKLNLWDNQISHLENLPQELQELNLWGNQIRQIQHLPQGLQRLYLNDNQISQLENLPQGLQELHLTGNQVGRIENLPQGLQELYLSRNQVSRIENLPERLQVLYLSENPTKNIPSELLSDGNGDHLFKVRAWFADLKNGSRANTTVKFMVSGNSNVGKSSLLEALHDGKAQPDQDSTHGIQIVPLSLPDGDQPVDGIAFDFGGQEIYHGTHQLFLRSRAVQLVVFDAKTEATALALDRRATQGEINRNKTLPDWLDDIHRLSPQSAVVIVQNKTEAPVPVPPATQTLINQLDASQELWTARVSARTGRGIAALRGTLAEAAQSLPEYGMLFPDSWLAVRNYFLDDSHKPVAERERIVTRVFFDQLCTNQHVLQGSESVLLRYLHDTGVVYYDTNYLNEFIIADQQWAIEAIYAALDRKGRLYDELANETFGKKRRKYLFGYFNETYTVDDRRLFMALMESCGLCFPLKEEHNGQITDDTYYLFPQFLPDIRPDSVAYFLANNAGCLVYRQTVTFLPYHHVQQLIARWGVKTDIRNIWRTGFLVNLPNEGRFVLDADLSTNTLILTAERTIPAETISRLRTELCYQETEWLLTGTEPAPAREKESISPSSKPVLDTVPDVVQPKIRKLVVSFAKEDVRYVNLLRQKMAARKTIDLWYDRHLTGWEDWDNQIEQHFTDCDGYVIFLSDTYMDAEMKTYIHEKEIPRMRQRFDAKQAFVAVVNVTAYNTQYTELAPFLSFKKTTLIPDPDQHPIDASQFLEEFINGPLYKDFLQGQ